MFKTDETDVTFTANTKARDVAQVLDEMAMRIVDGDVTVNSIREESAPIQMNGFGGVEMDGSKQLVLEYED